MSNYTDMYTTCIACSIEPPRVMFFFHRKRFLKTLIGEYTKKMNTKWLDRRRKVLKFFGHSLMGNSSLVNVQSIREEDLIVFVAQWLEEKPT